MDTFQSAARSQMHTLPAAQMQRLRRWKRSPAGIKFCWHRLCYRYRYYCHHEVFWPSIGANREQASVFVGMKVRDRVIMGVMSLPAKSSCNAMLCHGGREDDRLCAASLCYVPAFLEYLCKEGPRGCFHSARMGARSVCFYVQEANEKFQGRISSDVNFVLDKKKTNDSASYFVVLVLVSARQSAVAI